MTFTPAPWPRKLRSQEWFGGSGRDQIYHRGWMKNQGFPHDLFDGRPVIGILNTWSELTPCNAHLNDLAQRVKNGIYEAGGFPVEVPVFSASESAFRPTAMAFRNLAAMAVEEQMRGQPMDGCVLLVGCDKTTAVAFDGCRLHRPALDHRDRRADAERLLPQRARGLRHPSLEVLGGREGRRDDRRRIRRGRSLDEPLSGVVQHDGHRPRPWPPWPKRLAWPCPAMPRSRRWTAVAASWRS